MPYPLAFGAEAWRSVDHDHGFSVKNLPLVACQPNPPKRGGLGWIGDCVKRQLLQQEIFRATPFTPTLISRDWRLGRNLTEQRSATRKPHRFVGLAAYADPWHLCFFFFVAHLHRRRAMSSGAAGMRL
ncbi:hypothetical protein FSOLCH5_012102 [Fusarium solani]